MSTLFYSCHGYPCPTVPHRKDNLDQLGKIAAVLGTDDLLAYMGKYQVEVKPDIQKLVAKYVMRGCQRRKPWIDLLQDDCPMPSPDALDLLDKLLRYDHDERLTAQQAMRHTFFDNVRERVHTELRQRRLSQL